MTAMRGDRWEIGTSLAGAITGIFILAGTSKTGATLSLASAQAMLLAAGALAIRLTVTSSASAKEAVRSNQGLYETLVHKTSDAVFALAPGDWTVLEVNPAGLALCDATRDKVLHVPLKDMLHFTDEAFLRACRQKLTQGEPVVDAVTYARSAAGGRVMLRCNMTLLRDEEDVELIQAIVEAVPEEDEPAEAMVHPRDDFSINYIPTLTHELNNHLAAIRLSAELAETTGGHPISSRCSSR